MEKEERLKNKFLYKIEIYFIKILPVILALIYLLNTIFSYYNIDLIFLSYIGGTSLIPLVFMYISSYIFKFCIYHRLFLHYILINNILNIYDLYIGIPISNRNLFILYIIITGITIFLVTYFYVKNHKKSTTHYYR